MNEEITVLDLFSGIGGFSLGLERAGPFRTVAFCEQDQFAQRVLRKHWPDTPIFDDVRTIPTDRLGRIDLICGGFPCQPWSVAGNQRGSEDDRDLWPEMVRLVEKLRPKFLIGENVRGFINQPMGLQRSLSDLESIGYEAVPFIIPACAVDAPHRRDRVWIVAHADSQSEPDGTQHEQRMVANAEGNDARQFKQQPKNKEQQDRKEVRTRLRDELSRSGEDVADSKGKRLEGCEDARGAGGGRPHSNKQLGGCGEGNGRFWLPEPDVGRVAHGISNRVDRLKCLGNAVVPQVVEQIGRAIRKGHR
mgnify:CR=1 FL=1